MDLVRHWRRRAFGAAGATVIAPTAVILGALVVGVAGGGLKGLGSLSQALTGPELPVAVAVQRSADRRSGDEGSRLLAAAETAREERARPRESLPATSSPAGGDGPETRRVRRRGGSGPPSGDRRPKPPGGGPPAQNPPPPPPPQQPSVIRQTGDQVKEVVEPVPLVGETGAAVVEQLVTTADELCPPPACPLPVPLP